MINPTSVRPVICCGNLERALDFYQNKLGLTEHQATPDGHVFRVAGTDILISEVPDPTPSEHTIMGFEVEDLAKSISDWRRMVWCQKGYLMFLMMK